MIRLFNRLVLFILLLPLQGNGQVPQDSPFDLIVKGGTVYDGTGGAPRRVDVGIKADRIIAVGKLESSKASTVVDARGLAVAPGFINMLSQSWGSLLVDGRSQGEIRQGVTTQIMGEGWSMGPLTEEMKQQRIAAQADIKFDITWNTLAEYLTYLQKRGVSQNFASFVGATTVREYVVGLEDKKATGWFLRLRLALRLMWPARPRIAGNLQPVLE